MADKIENGDYSLVDDGRGLKQIEHFDEMLQNVAVTLNVRRGRFYPNKDFGCNVINSSKQPVLEYALNYARQAVDSIDGVYIKGAEFENDNICFTVLINGREGQVRIGIENNI